MSWGAIVVAAGRGSRFGRPKQLIEIAGKPMLAWSIETFASMPEIAALVVTIEPDLLAEAQRLVRAISPQLEPRVIAGGVERQDSVRLALAALPESCDYALIHDGARPLVGADEVRRGMAVAAPGIGALLAVPVVDTIKEIDSAARVIRTLDRAMLWAAQTPQFGTLADLRRAHSEAFESGVRATDDATLLERCGCDVIVVEGRPENFKVTVPADLIRVELILKERRALSSQP